MICSWVFSSLGDYVFKTEQRKGRFPEEKVFEYYIGRGEKISRLLVLMIFEGRRPYYGKWIEVFSIKPVLNFNSRVFEFINSKYEKEFISCIAQHLAPTEKLYIEYLYDFETWKALELGFPPYLTRLGFMLLENGFTWFKDWYYPEGFMEGGPKLQAEKPVNQEAQLRHIKEICEETSSFMEKTRDRLKETAYKEILFRALQRAEILLNALCGVYLIK